MPMPGEQKTRRIMAALLTVAAVAALAVFPLFTDFTYTHITRTKWYAALGLGALSLLCALGAMTVCLCRGHRQLLHGSWVALLAVGYVAMVGVSAWLGPIGHQLNDRGEWVWWMGAVRYEGLAAKLVYLLIFLCMSVYRPRRRVTLAAIAVALALFSGVVALQYAGYNPLGLYPAGRSVRTNYEFQGTLGNIDMVSGYLSLVMPMMVAGFLMLRNRVRYLLLAAGTLGMFLELCMEVQSGLLVLAAMLAWVVGYGLCHPSRRRDCLWVLALFALCAALRKAIQLPWLDNVEDVTFTLGRTSLVLLAMAALLMISAETWGRTRRFALKPRTVLALGAAVVVCACIFLAIVELPESRGGLYELSEILHGRARDSFGSYRLGAWRMALRTCAQYPWTGAGPNTFIFTIQEELYKAGLSFPETFDSAHNGYLTMLSENGIPAFVLYVGFLGCLLWQGVRGAKKRPWLWVTTLGIACYAFQDFFSFSICLVAPMFWALLGIHLAELCHAGEIEWSEEASELQRRNM